MISKGLCTWKEYLQLIVQELGSEVPTSSIHLYVQANSGVPYPPTRRNINTDLAALAQAGLLAVKIAPRQRRGGYPEKLWTSEWPRLQKTLKEILQYEISES